MYPEEQSAKSITVNDRNLTVDGFSFNRGPISPAIRKESKVFKDLVEFYSNKVWKVGLNWAMNGH